MRNPDRNPREKFYLQIGLLLSSFGRISHLITGEASEIEVFYTVLTIDIIGFIIGQKICTVDDCNFKDFSGRFDQRNSFSLDFFTDVTVMLNYVQVGISTQTSHFFIGIKNP